MPEVMRCVLRCTLEILPVSGVNLLCAALFAEDSEDAEGTEGDALYDT